MVVAVDRLLPSVAAQLRAAAAREPVATIAQQVAGWQLPMLLGLQMAVLQEATLERAMARRAAEQEPRLAMQGLKFAGPLQAGHPRHQSRSRRENWLPAPRSCRRQSKLQQLCALESRAPPTC